MLPRTIRHRQLAWLVVRFHRLEFTMNQRLQGWKLALALLIPAAIIGAAGYVTYGALSDDDQGVATGDDNGAATTTPVPTTQAETQTVDATEDTSPTAIPPPTPLTVPSAPAVPAATSGPAVAPTATPAPTTPPAPQPTTPQGPAPTATPDASVVTISCVGTIPGCSRDRSDPWASHRTHGSSRRGR